MARTSIGIPGDYSARVRNVRNRLELTQVKLAERIGVSFATVNRWENDQSKPTRLAWQQILDLEAGLDTSQEDTQPAAMDPFPQLDFATSARGRRGSRGNPSYLWSSFQPGLCHGNLLD